MVCCVFLFVRRVMCLRDITSIAIYIGFMFLVGIVLNKRLTFVKRIKYISNRKLFLFGKKCDKSGK